MKKLYTERQYKKYCKMLDEMANEVDFNDNFGLYLMINQWIADQQLSKEAIKLMDQRMESEFAQLG